MSTQYIEHAPMPCLVRRVYVIEELKADAGTELQSPAPTAALPINRKGSQRQERSGRAFTWG